MVYVVVALGVIIIALMWKTYNLLVDIHNHLRDISFHTQRIPIDPATQDTDKRLPQSWREGISD